MVIIIVLKVKSDVDQPFTGIVGTGEGGYIFSV